MSEFLARGATIVLYSVLHVLLLASSLLVSTQATAADTAPAFSREQLDQLTAPVALYPDSLLSQVLMAATYPADVVDAAKWSKANPDSKGDAAVKAVDGQSWDPSVKSLVAFPQVLAMMGEKPDWVQNLGDAFLASSKDVLDSVQRLRAKAKEAGNLKSNEQQKVVVQPAATAAQATQTTTVAAPPAQVIVIEPSDPQVVYVPTYNPTVVYGPWPYPAYPPYYYPPPPMYYPGAALASGIAFGIGVGITASLWGNCDWHHGDVDIDVNRFNNINVHNKINANQNKFQHNAANRRGVPYRDAQSRQQFSRNLPGAENRADFRGRDPAREAQRQSAQTSLQQRGMDPGKAREQLRNDPQVRERAQNAARDTGRDGFDRGRTDGFNRDGAGSRNLGGATQHDFKQSPAERNLGANTERARGASDNAFRNSDNALRSRQQIDRGSASRMQMQRSGGGMHRGGGGFRR